jgi:hypothetical protein
MHSSAPKIGLTELTVAQVSCLDVEVLSMPFNGSRLTGLCLPPISIYMF